MDTFGFCPASNVPTIIPPDPIQGQSMNGWTFTSKPVIPYQKSFNVMLHGMRWYLNADGTFDTTTDPQHNARALELFYEVHGVWAPFLWTHQHIGQLAVRFRTALKIPAGDQNGLLTDPLEVDFIHHNPSY